MKMFKDFGEMFNAQSSMKKDMSVFNEFSDLDPSGSFEKYENLFDCLFVPSKNRKNCYTCFIKPKNEVKKRVDEYGLAYDGIDDIEGIVGELSDFDVRLSFYVEVDSKNFCVKVLYTKDNNKTQSVSLDINDIKNKGEVIKKVLSTPFVKDLRDSLDKWKDAYVELNNYLLSGDE